MYEFRIGDGIDALFRNQIRRVTAGYGVREGLEVEVGGSGTDIELEVSSGIAQFEESTTTVASQTVILEDGHEEYPRKDVIYVAEDGNTYAIKGEADESVPRDLERTQTAVPQPPDTRDLEGVVIAVVWIPAGSGDSNSLEEADIQDRRFPAIDVVDQITEYTRALPLTSLDDGGSATLPITLASGETFTLIGWGISHIDNQGGTAQGVPSGIELQLINPNGNIEETTSSRWADGIDVELENDTDFRQILLLRMKNDSGTDFGPPDGFQSDIRYEIH